MYEDEERDIGDVVYALYPEFEHEHGRQLPTAEFGKDSMRSLLTFTGQGIKKRHMVKRNVWLIDIVPTLCYIMGLSVPKDAEGAIVYDLLEDPDFQIKKIAMLEKECARWRKSQDRYRRVTHENP